MNKLKSLEIKRLLKQLDYIESDLEYTSEVISEADSEFIRCVNEFLQIHPELKDMYDKKITEKINETIKNKIEDVEKEAEEADEEKDGGDNEDGSSEKNNMEEEGKNIDEEIQVKEDNSKLKKLYREIVKLTHPDIVSKKHLNELYIEATMYYDNNDKIGIYKICSQLNIDYEIEEDDAEFISTKIDSLRKKIGFLESTFTWKWYKTDDEVERNQIMINYIKLRLQ